MSKWNYGGYADKYDMNGVIQIGTGKVKVHNIFDPLPDFMREADTVIVDPPCSLGNINSFYTKAGRLDYQTSYMPFAMRLWEVIDEIAPKTVVMELFKSNRELMEAEAKRRYEYVDVYNSTYYHNKKNKCYIMVCTNDYDFTNPPLEGMDEQDVIEWVCKNMEYECIGDPCMGRGLVGFYANKYGRRFVGTELNGNRLAVLLERINRGKL